MPYKEIKEINVDIDRLDDSNKLIYDALKEWWLSSYISDLDPDENIPAIIEQWIDKYVNTDVTKDAIEKIKEASPPEEIKIKLVIDLLTREGFLKLEDEIPSEDERQKVKHETQPVERERRPVQDETQTTRR